VSFESVTFSEELRKLDEADRERKESEKKLRTFILSDAFLKDEIAFENHLSDFRSKVITFVERATEPNPQLQQAMLQSGQAPDEKAESKLQMFSQVSQEITLTKALVLVFIIVGTTILTQHGILPPLFVAGIIAFVLFLVFHEQISSMFRALTHRDSENEELNLANLSDEVSTRITKMRKKYESARFLIKFQTQKQEDLPSQYQDLTSDPALFDREQYFRETLPHEFLGYIGDIMDACDDSLMQRKRMFVSAMVQTTQMQQHQQ